MEQKSHLRHVLLLGVHCEYCLQTKFLFCFVLFVYDSYISVVSFVRVSWNEIMMISSENYKPTLPSPYKPGDTVVC